MLMNKKVKILHIDIETAPMQCYTWSLFKPMIAIDNIVHDWYVLCWAAKWDNEPDVYFDALWLNKGYKKDMRNDRDIVSTIWGMLNEADIVVGHNGKRFDVAKLNAKFFEFGFGPPKPFKVVDTLSVARANFKLSSNKLDYISKLRAFGSKLDTNFRLWLDVMAGDKKQCARMLEYNIHDVELLEDVYHDMLPWITNHPNVVLYSDTIVPACAKCGSEDLKKDGTTKLAAGIYQQYKCKSCGGWVRGGHNLAPLASRKNLLRNVAS